MKNKAVVLLTGATGGIGQAIADKLAGEGASIVLVGRTAEKLESLASRLRDKHQNQHQSYACIADISHDSGRQKILDFIRALPEQVNLLINNAGINEFALIENQSDEMVERILHVNTTSQILLTKKLLPYFHDKGDVQVINIGSTFGSIGYPGYSIYSASKFALRGFTEAMAREYGDTPIRFKYFSPRATATSLNNKSVVAMNRELKVSMDTPELVAGKLIKFIDSGSSSTYLGWPEKLFVRINQLFPSIVSQSICKTLPIIRRYAKQQYS